MGQIWEQSKTLFFCDDREGHKDLPRQHTCGRLQPVLLHHPTPGPQHTMLPTWLLCHPQKQPGSSTHLSGDPAVGTSPDSSLHVKMTGALWARTLSPSVLYSPPVPVGASRGSGLTRITVSWVCSFSAQRLSLEQRRRMGMGQASVTLGVFFSTCTLCVCVYGRQRGLNTESAESTSPHNSCQRHTTVFKPLSCHRAFLPSLTCSMSDCYHCSGSFQEERFLDRN